jgi:hypothetical protein
VCLKQKHLVAAACDQMPMLEHWNSEVVVAA